jgi:hypothetical protein
LGNPDDNCQEKKAEGFFTQPRAPGPASLETGDKPREARTGHERRAGSHQRRFHY